MSMFGDYKLYKKYEPAYESWKYERDLTEAKRQKYLEEHPEAINNADIRKGQALLRAIDVIDEYSQKRAENMEAATETIVSNGLSLAMIGGGALGGIVGKTKSVTNLLNKMTKGSKYAKILQTGIPIACGVILGTLAAIPLYAWAAKAEVGASRKGRFEAMRKDLVNPKGFAVLTDEQYALAQKQAENVIIDDEKKNSFASLAGGAKTLKEMAVDSKEYKQQRKLFEMELQEAQKHINDELSPEEALNAKKDQQLLTKLVEKIDIASQDYAENAELATQTLVTGTLALGVLFNMLLQKIMALLKIKSQNKIAAVSNVLAICIPAVLSVFAAQIQKQASRVGRFKIKRELMSNPSQWVYVDDTKISEVKDVKVTPHKKQGIFDFLKEIWKDNKEYNKYQKTKAKEEKKFYKALEGLELGPKQTEDAQRLQKNTFRTFNKIDENSQKYAESIEALGQAVSYPVGLIFSLLGLTFGSKFLMKPAKTKLEMASNMSKYISVILLSTVPSILINAYITKEQKKASRVANMMAINEMSDYRQFRG